MYVLYTVFFMRHISTDLFTQQMQCVFNYLYV